MSTAKPETADALSLPEMLRIMDVATALRQDRELVEEQLNFGDLKARLREKMLATAKVTGEDVSPEEVDAAIDLYYRRMHAYRDPPMSLSVFLAHVYVRRRAIAWGAGLLLLMSAMGWWLLGSRSAPLTERGRMHRAVVQLASDMSRRVAAVKASSRDPDAVAELERLTAEADTYRAQDDLEKLKGVSARIDDLATRLEAEYTVTIIQGSPTRGSAIDRYFTDKDGKRVSGFYLIVEARAPDGTVVARRIHNSETDRDREVDVWGERVPKEVYDRLRADKKADGILDEKTFAVKRRGRAQEEIVMPGPDGKPLARLGQITEW